MAYIKSCSNDAAIIVIIFANLEMWSIKFIVVFILFVSSSALPHTNILKNNPVLTSDEDAYLTVVRKYDLRKD
jgi:hypothetical protein